MAEETGFDFSGTLNSFTAGALQLIQARNQIRAEISNSRDNATTGNTTPAAPPQSSGIPNGVFLILGVAVVAYLVRNKG